MKQKFIATEQKQDKLLVTGARTVISILSPRLLN